MTKRYISLREVGRQLNVPPSTIVYYKDRFTRHIPSVGGEGRRRRYPSEVLEIFRRIREMFENNWSAEQIEAELSSGTDPDGSAVKAENRDGESGNGSLVTDILDGQLRFRDEIRNLVKEVASLKKERLEADEAHVRAIDELNGELIALREENKRLARQLAAGDELQKTDIFPPNDLLALPLVFRNSKNEFRGVLGKTKKRFTLNDFLELIDAGASENGVEMSWGRESDRWVLMFTSPGENGNGQKILMVIGMVVTPRKNKVARIVRLNINGGDVPDSLLPGLFRQVRARFER